MLLHGKELRLGLLLLLLNWLWLRQHLRLLKGSRLRVNDLVKVNMRSAWLLLLLPGAAIFSQECCKADCH